MLALPASSQQPTTAHHSPPTKVLVTMPPFPEVFAKLMAPPSGNNKLRNFAKLVAQSFITLVLLVAVVALLAFTILGIEELIPYSLDTEHPFEYMPGLAILAAFLLVAAALFLVGTVRARAALMSTRSVERESRERRDEEQGRARVSLPPAYETK